MGKFFIRKGADSQELCMLYDMVRSSLPLPPGGVLLVLAHLQGADQFTPDESWIRDWYAQMVDYPKARAELVKRLPDPYEYSWGLSQALSRHGYAYSMELNYPAGPWRFGRTLAQAMRELMRTLTESCGYSFQPELGDVPVLDYQDIYEIMHKEGAPPDEIEAYTHDMWALHGIRINRIPEYPG